MEQSPKSVARARALRLSSTEAEKRLWGSLRGSRLNAFKFRRQMPVPPSIVDFACVSGRLIIEVDGATHGDTNEIQYDDKRTAYFESKGFKVHRISNHDVFTNLGGVLDTILILLTQKNSG